MPLLSYQGSRVIPPSNPEVYNENYGGCVDNETLTTNLYLWCKFMHAMEARVCAPFPQFIEFFQRLLYFRTLLKGEWINTAEL